MTKILTSPLIGSALEQTITVSGEDRRIIGSIAPYLYVHNTPAGNIVFRIEKNSTTIFTQTIAIADIKAGLGTANNFYHVWYPIVPTNPLLIENGNYDLILEAGTYVYSDSAWIGWCTAHENLQLGYAYTPADDSEKPLAVRIKDKKQGFLK